VVERTAQLGVATGELEAFAAAAAQDLSGPLRRIKSFGQALMEDYGAKLDIGGQDFLNRLLAASQQMAELIEALVHLSRLAARPQISRETVDLSRLAESLLAEFHQVEPQREVEEVIAPGLNVEGDKELLTILITHLLENAWKFTSTHPRARIELGVFRQADGELAYFVRDDGVGFDPAASDKLFMAFQCLHPRSEYEGVGVGLAIAQRIVRHHGGHIWAEGNVGQGATFYFTLFQEDKL